MALTNVALKTNGIIQIHQNGMKKDNQLNQFFMTASVGVAMFINTLSPVPTAQPDIKISVIKSFGTTYNIGTRVNTGKVERQEESNLMTPTSRGKTSGIRTDSKVVRGGLVSTMDTSMLFPEQKIEYLAGDRPFTNARVVPSSKLTRGFLKK